MRKETINTFSEGLVMDLNPLTTPNNVLTSCLNGTIITYNGNEYVLLNDMGNGRVETAYLPAGYVPVGMTEFGGIVYVVSYNPLLNKSQIGSFPSPERNISSEEASNLKVELTNDDFGYTSDGAKSFYVQKDLYKDKLNPGDKFIVYAGSGQITENKDKLSEYVKGDNTSENVNSDNTKLVRLSLATITDEGKIVKLTNLRKYKIGKADTYIIPEMERNADTGFPNVDSYRSITESPYNVFNSRISGKLLLIAELITVDTFNVTTDVEFGDTEETEETEDTEDSKKAKIKVSMDYESDEDVYLSGVLGKVTDGEGKDKNYEWPENTRELLDVILHTVYKYDTKERDKRDIFWELTPCMKFGPIPYLKKSGVIELDKVGTGFIDLSEWRYYVDNNNIQLNWALQSYPEPNHKIAGVRFILSGYNDLGTIDTIVYQVSEKRSYNGSFTETIPFNSSFYKIKDNGLLLPNKLYCVTVEVLYMLYKKIEGGDTSKYKYFHRFLYTTDIFNQQYIEGKVVDFKALTPGLSVGTETESTFKKISLDEPLFKLGKMFEDTAIEEKDTMSAVRLYTKLSLEGKVTPKLIENYNLFDIEDSSVYIKTIINENDATISFSPYKVTYTLSDSINMDNYLELRLNENYSGGSIDLPTSKEDMKNLVEEDTKSEYDLGIKIMSTVNQDMHGDNDTFSTEVDIIEFIKAFAHPSKKEILYKGVLQPIAYNEETFDKYNLKYSSRIFIGTATCAFGQYEEGGSDGFEFYYDATGDVLRYETLGDSGEELETDFTADGIQNAMAAAWKSVTGSIAVCIYAYDHKKSSYLIPVNKSVKSTWPWKLQGESYNHISGNGGDGGVDVWNPINCDVAGVFVFIKRTDGKWCPINMVSNMGTKDLAINVATLKFNRSNLAGFYNIYTVLASMLNQMYTYDGASQIAEKYIPISVYYIPRYNTTFNVKILNEIKNSEDITIQIISGGTKYNLDEDLATELFGKNTIKSKNQDNDKLEKDDTLFYNNITPNITVNKEENLATYVTQNSGIELRDMILEYTKTSYEALIITNTGNVLNSNANLNSSNLYYMVGDSPSKINSSFKFKDIREWKESDGRYIPDEGGNTSISSQNIANKFVMLDGELRLNETYAPPRTRMLRTLAGEGDNGSLGAFADFAPIDFLQCWEGS